MSSSVENQPHGNIHSDDDQALFLPSCVHRVASIPVVADTLEVIQSTVLSNAYLSNIYGIAEGIATYLYQHSKPLQHKISGPIHHVDAVANKGLDFVQSKAPYVFEIKTEDLISRARQPADQALAVGKTYKDAATARIGPIMEQFHSQLTKSQQTLILLQDKLQSGLHNLRKDPKAVPDHIKQLSEQLVSELGRLSHFVGEKSHELPQQAQQLIGPLVEKLQK